MKEEKKLIFCWNLSVYDWTTSETFVLVSSGQVWQSQLFMCVCPRLYSRLCTLLCYQLWATSCQPWSTPYPRLTIPSLHLTYSGRHLAHLWPMSRPPWPTSYLLWPTSCPPLPSYSRPDFRNLFSKPFYQLQFSLVIPSEKLFLHVVLQLAAATTSLSL